MCPKYVALMNTGKESDAFVKIWYPIITQKLKEVILSNTKEFLAQGNKYKTFFFYVSRFPPTYIRIICSNVTY